MAAVLAAGREAALSYHSAAALWRLRSGEPAPIDVAAPRALASREGVRFHRATLPSDELTIRDGIPVTTVTRTLFDLGAVLSPRRLERALNEAEVLRLWDRLTLDDLLGRYARRPGNRAVRAALRARRAGATVTRSALEERFLDLVDAHGLERPEVNALVEGMEVDAVWRPARLAVELDGRAAHGTVRAFEADRERDRILQAQGWRVIRVTFRQLRDTPGAVVADLRRLLPGYRSLSR
jgi:very-short-patch-repair endonuclease